MANTSLASTGAVDVGGDTDRERGDDRGSGRPASDATADRWDDVFAQRVRPRHPGPVPSANRPASLSMTGPRAATSTGGPPAGRSRWPAPSRAHPRTTPILPGGAASTPTGTPACGWPVCRTTCRASTRSRSDETARSRARTVRRRRPGRWPPVEPWRRGDGDRWVRPPYRARSLRPPTGHREVVMASRLRCCSTTLRRTRRRRPDGIRRLPDRWCPPLVPDRCALETSTLDEGPLRPAGMRRAERARPPCRAEG